MATGREYEAKKIRQTEKHSNKTNKKLGSGIAGLSDHKAEETLAQDK